MQINRKRIHYLLKKLKRGIASPQEIDELDSLYQAVNFEDVPLLTENESIDNFYERYMDVMKRAARKKTYKNIKRIGISISSVAAVILLIIGIVKLNAGFNKNIDRVVATSINEVLPGHDGAVLTLADGRKIVLDSAGNGSIAKEGNIQIVNENGQLLYKGRSAAVEHVEYNTLTTPKGRQYKITLPDGTRVWLNAGSSISYPTTFVGEERKVIMSGEAYFEVTKSILPNGKKMPFKIDVMRSDRNAQNIELEVLGTSFNVNAYSDEPVFKTTLVEGKVKISVANKSSIITPLQQLIVDRQGNNFVHSDINLDEITAWKDGMFYFNHTDLNTILRQFSRWYDIDIEAEKELGKRFFTGKINKSENLNDVLKIMEVSDISFKKMGNKLIIGN